MATAKVAVIMPCYNAAAYLLETIESVLAQTFTDFQFIAGNDGSTDNTAEILARYADRITIVSHPDGGNHGQAATYNLCLQHAEAEYIAFIDNDDLWEKDKLEKQVAILDRYPYIGLVYTNGHVINGSNRIMYSFLGPAHEESNQVGGILLDCYIRTPSTVMVRSALLSQAGQFKVGIIPDHDMWIRIKELSDFYYLNEKLFRYRVHDDQLSRKSTEKMWRDGFGTLDRAMQRYPYPPAIRKKRLAVIHYRLAQLGISSRKLSLVPHLVLACLYDPSRACRTVMSSLRKK